MSHILLLAVVYNLLWGTFVVLLPGVLFTWAGMEQPRYPELWQCIGMIVGVYGIGYAAAALDPARHWPIVLVGLAGKVFGPIGFGMALVTGRFAAEFGWVILFNDLIWWIPFGLILLHARRLHLEQETDINRAPEEAEAILQQAVTQDGESLLDMSNEAPLLLVFLRHFGCTFCREAIAELASKQTGIQATGSKIVFVHMSEDKEAAEFFEEYGMGDVARVSDPSGDIYRTFNLHRGNRSQLLGWKVLKRGVEAGLIKGHGVGLPAGDIRQMPGVFLIYRGELLKSFRHKSSSDRPDYTAMSNIWPFTLTLSAMSSGRKEVMADPLAKPVSRICST